MQCFHAFAWLRVFTHSGFDDDTLEVIASLRQFRDAVLELPGGFGGGRDDPVECSVRQLRVLYARLHDEGLQGCAAVAEYWAHKLQQLPKDDEMVSADEISAALLQWLEDILGYGEGSEAGGGLIDWVLHRCQQPALWGLLS